MRGSREWRGFRCCAALVCSYVCLCFRVCESLRRQEIARVVRVGSTPRGTEKEQREHLPPLQEQLFNPPRRGDAGMGGEKRRAERWQAKLHSSAFLFHLFTFTVSSNSPPPVPYTQWVHGDWWCRFFFLSLLLVSDKVEKTPAACILANL